MTYGTFMVYVAKHEIIIICVYFMLFHINDEESNSLTFKKT